MSARISSAASAHVFSSARSSRIAASLAARSERDPAHQLRRHVVLRGSAGLPDALVGLAPRREGALGLRLHERPQAPGQVLVAAGVQQERVEHGAVDVVLTLVEGSVAEADRLGALVAREFVPGRLGQVTAAVDAVHDLQAAVVVRLEVGHELHELVGLPVEVQEVQGLQGERRVPHPRVAVVPVPLAARGLGQRRGERRDRGTRRHVGEALDRQRGSLQEGSQRSGRGCALAPATAARSRPCARSVRRHRPRRRARRSPSAHDSAQNAFSPFDSVCRARAELPSSPMDMSVLSRNVCPAPVASAACPSSSTIDHPAGCASVVERGLADQFDLDRAFEALDQPHQDVLGIVVGRRPRVRGDQVGTRAGVPS